MVKDIMMNLGVDLKKGEVHIEFKTSKRIEEELDGDIIIDENIVNDTICSTIGYEIHPKDVTRKGRIIMMIYDAEPFLEYFVNHE